jgi:hypothetical protein
MVMLHGLAAGSRPAPEFIASWFNNRVVAGMNVNNL